jgi:RNA polymerase sigma-54 factor
VQLSRLELQQSVSQELLENPVLETARAPTRAKEGDAAPDGTQEKLPESVPEPDVTGELKSDLELGPQWDEYLNEMGDGRDYGNAEADDKELPSYDQTLTRLPSLSDHLMWQLRLSTSEPSLVKGGEWIIGNLDDDGYLRSPLEELAQQAGVSPSTWRRH